MSLLTAGLASLLQVYPVWKIGSRLPLMMGTSVIFISAIVIIGQKYGLSGVFGSILIASLIEIVLAFSMKHIRKIITPLVNGIVIMSIGVSLFMLALRYNIATIEQTDFSLFSVLIVTLLVVAVTYIILLKSTSKLKVYAFIVSILFGIIISGLFGMIDITQYSSTSVLMIPSPLKYGLSFPIEGIILFTILFIVSGLETIADTTALTTGVYNRDPEDSEYQGALLADGTSSFLSSIVSGFPKTTYTQNVGIIISTKESDKWGIVIASALLILLSFFPPFGSLFIMIPKPVVSGFFLSISFIIISNGFNLLKPHFISKTYIIFGITILLALFLYNLTDIIGTKYSSSLFVDSIEKNAILLSGMLSLLLEQTTIIYSKIKNKIKRP